MKRKSYLLYISSFMKKFLVVEYSMNLHDTIFTFDLECRFNFPSVASNLIIVGSLVHLTLRLLSNAVVELLANNAVEGVSGSPPFMLVCLAGWLAGYLARVRNPSFRTGVI